LAEEARLGARSTKAEYRVVVRARIVSDAVAGFSNEENARRNGVGPDTVRKWRLRAAQATSVAGAFADAPRSGRPARIAVETRATLVQLACSTPTPELAKERVRARVKHALRAERSATKRVKRARASERRAARREKAAQAARDRDAARCARKERQAAVRALKRANKSLMAASVQLTEAHADAARAAKGTPRSSSAVWTHATLQAELERQTGQTLSLSEVGRILRCGGLRPHRVRIWLHSPDPHFQDKARTICALYANPPPGAVVLCVDEKTGMQARAALNPLHASKRGVMRCEFEYVRHGTSTLIAAFNIQTGEVFGRCWRRTAAGVQRFLEALAKKYPEGEVWIVWDNLNVHSGPAIDAFSARHGGRFHFVYTPLHASWMNQVEIWFSILQRRVLRHGSFSSKADIEAAVMAFIREWNEVERRPFRWRFRGDFLHGLPWVSRNPAHAEARRRPDASCLARRAA
jgi:transposase